MQIPKGGIAFFDSGIGGLTVLAECEKRLPTQLFYYYGDNRHAPYGNLPVRKIRKYVLRAFKKFHRLRVSAAVIACNTATAVCAEELRAKYSFPIIGAEPAVIPAAARGGKVLVLATKATCESQRLMELCQRAKQLFPTAEISIHACEHLAGVIERNVHKVGYDFTPYLPNTFADAVVLGCTHYIYIVAQIERHFGCPVYDGNEGIARRLVGFFNADSLSDENRDKQPLIGKSDPKMGFLTTDKHKRGYCQKITNKRSQKIEQKASKKRKMGGVIFLGNTRDYNQKTHEQMFVSLKRVRGG